MLNTGVYGGSYEFLAAFGADKVYEDYASLTSNNADRGKWLFGALSFDLKNKFEQLSSDNTIDIAVPELQLFVPQLVISIDKQGNLKIEKGTIPDSFFSSAFTKSSQKIEPSINPITKENYLEKIRTIHTLIQEGEVYELNYCLNHTHAYKAFDPVQFQLDLLKKSPVPMASYLKAKNIHLCGASMERYVLKKGDKIISQPIKGTIKKGRDFQEDAALILELENSEKDRAENVMIVDLVRNDLARICVPGSIQVEELFGIYSYLQVHQMISTVSGQLKKDIHFRDILEGTFPMGSMTGAPKIAALQHIEHLENFRRGWYSGTVGYITPGGDFDFNVVIRSVLVDDDTKKISYAAGGAITIDSIPEKEWDEIQLKTKAITDVLNSH